MIAHTSFISHTIALIFYDIKLKKCYIGLILGMTIGWGQIFYSLSSNKEIFFILFPFMSLSLLSLRNLIVSYYVSYLL